MSIAICGIAKNENLYVREWVEYHKYIGVKKIFIYDNNDIDGEQLEEVLYDYIPSFVEIINVRGIEKESTQEDGLILQNHCYVECYNNHKSEYDYMAFIDIDEFINTKNKDINEVLASYNKFDTLLLSWKNHGDNGLVRYDNRPVRERFTGGVRSNTGFRNNKCCKSIVHCGNKDIIIAPKASIRHKFLFKNGINIDSIGKIIKEINPFSSQLLSPVYGKLYIDHYITKTLEEYLFRYYNRVDSSSISKKRRFLLVDVINNFYKFNYESAEKSKVFKEFKDTSTTVKEKYEALKAKYVIDKPKYLKIALCTMGKWENHYIREWVEYYKNLGISKIFLYDNNDIDGERFEYVINDYIESGFVKVIDIRGKSKYQLKVYIDFYNNYSKYYDWCCFFDIDEFLVLKKDSSIQEYLNRQEFKCFDSIAINWKNYGDNDLLGYEDKTYSCLNRFTTPIINTPGAKYDNDVYKKIIRGGLKIISDKLDSPHTFSPDLDKDVCNNMGVKINGKHFKTLYNEELAYIKHFCTKTISEYLYKSKRGGGVNGVTKQYTNIDNFFIYNKRTKEKEDIINKFLNKHNKINLLVINYNTPYLIDTLIKSIKLHVNSIWHLYIFDNSDKTECYKSNEDNITIFDNTKGEIINFDKWLEQFPDRFDSWARVNKWGSAKHCYTVERCFDIINDNFILLDSDILLKKDISELYRNDMFYAGEISKLKTQNLERISPYLCFINVKLCKANNIHYFYPDYMHGLNKEAHNYDTGGAFYKFVKDYEHININCSDYIVHFGQGSWAIYDGKEIYKKDITIQEWLDQYKYLYDEHEALKQKLLEFSKKNYPNLDLNLDTPITIQDKINWLKIYDSTPLKTKCADKIKLHEYCIEKLGVDLCVPIIKVYNDTSEILWDELPNSFVIKCNHGSGMNIIVKDKNTLNKVDAINKLNKWMNKDFSVSWGYEPHYRDIERKIFVEEFIGSGDIDIPDYKIACFNGEPNFLQVMNNRFAGHLSVNYYTLDLKPFNYGRKDHLPNYSINTFPKDIDKLVKYAKILSEDFKFVRVDFYEVNDRVYLGELTFTPGSGFFEYTDPDASIKLGNLLNLGE